MYASESLAVVVPAYNEAAFIQNVVETIPAYVDTIVVVDDHSTDGTWREIRSCMGSNDPEAPVASDHADQLLTTDGAGTNEVYRQSTTDVDLVAVRHSENRGRGAAVKTGYRLAVEAAHDVVAVMDGDGQMDPDDLERLVDPIVDGDADYAKGNRLVDRRHCVDMSNWRLFGNGILTILTKVASGLWHVRDPQNGYTAVSADALSALSIDDLYDDYGFLNDVLIRMAYHDLRVVDVPIEALYADEESGIKYRSFVPNLSLLLARGFAWRLLAKYADVELGSGLIDGDAR
jgi:glycosyltransferase involved in cell wall biosynthesis